MRPRSRGSSTDEARLEHIATECLAKAVHIVLGSRLNKRSNSRQGVRDNRNRWFNLETEEVDVAAQSIDLWKRDTGMCLVAEVYGKKATPEEEDDDVDLDLSGSLCETGHLLESWSFRVRKKDFGSGSSGNNSTSGSGSSGSSSSQTRLTRVSQTRLDTPLVYKRAVIFLRSLFCFVRLLPAFSVCQVTRRSTSCKLSITAKLRVVREPESPADTAGLASYEFKRIDTPVGEICVECRYAERPVDVLRDGSSSSILAPSGRFPPSMPRPAPSSAREASAAAAIPIAKSWDKRSPLSSSPLSGLSPQGFAPHSAPMRRQSWSYTGKQAANARRDSKFSEVMTAEDKDDGETRPRRSSAMKIPIQGRPPTSSSRGNSRGNSVDSAAGSSLKLSTMVRTPPHTMGSSSSGSGVPLSCSPQLPFAMTPKLPSSASSMSYDFQAAPSLGRAIRLVRKGPSPVQGHAGLSADLPSMNFGSLGESAEGSPGDSPWNISGESPNDAALASLLGDSDALPFALDVSSPGEEAPGRGGESGDAEIGAFVRALQDAPPLRNSESSLSCRTLSSAMLELRQLKEFVSFQS